jgi:hypothetical protein
VRIKEGNVFCYRLCDVGFVNVKVAHPLLARLPAFPIHRAHVGSRREKLSTERVAVVFKDRPPAFIADLMCVRFARRLRSVRRINSPRRSLPRFSLYSILLSRV